MALHPRLTSAWWTLRIGLGLAPLIAGIDKFFNLLTNWDMYLNPMIPRVLHLSAPAFMHISGAIEILVGLLMFTRLTWYIAYVVMLWLWAIALNLLTQGQFLDIAVRDVLISLGAFALAKLTEVREEAAETTSLSSRGATANAVRPAI